MPGSQQTLIEAYSQMHGSTHLLLETTVDELVAYYEERAEELSKGEVNFYFIRERKGGKTLSIAADVLHTDSLLGQIDDPDYDVNKFDISKYIPDVVEALKAEGIQAGLGMAFSNGGILLSTVKYPVTVNDYQTDSLTVVIDIDNIEVGLQKDPEAILKAIDTFILKMVAVDKRLQQKYPS